MLIADLRTPRCCRNSPRRRERSAEGITLRKTPIQDGAFAGEAAGQPVPHEFEKIVTARIAAVPARADEPVKLPVPCEAPFRTGIQPVGPVRRQFAIQPSAGFSEDAVGDHPRHQLCRAFDAGPQRSDKVPRPCRARASVSRTRRRLRRRATGCGATVPPFAAADCLGCRAQPERNGDWLSNFLFLQRARFHRAWGRGWHTPVHLSAGPPRSRHFAAWLLSGRCKLHLCRIPDTHGFLRVR